MLKIGDRVSTQESPSKPRKHGIIIDRYKSKQGVGFTPFVMFAIKWDDIEQVQKGYLEQYLQKED